MATMEELETTKTEPEKKPIRRARGYFDYSLLFVWIFIMLLGYVLLYSASSYVALTSTDVGGTLQNMHIWAH